MKEVVVLIGTGAIGFAIAKRISLGKYLLLADLQQENAAKAAKKLLDDGFEADPVSVDVTSRASVQSLVDKAGKIGDISGVIHAAGVAPSSSAPEMILKVDLLGTALVLEQFGNVINKDGACVVVSSQAGHKLSPLSPAQTKALATTPADDLLDLPMLQPDQIKDSFHAYQIAKHGCSLRVMAEAVRWGRRKARVNTLSPGIIGTPLADKELKGTQGEEYRQMIKSCPAQRVGTLDEVAKIGALLMGPDADFITGSDFLIDGGMSASYWFGD
jgi:NAD(P)-dependent dehydrogenase (short-subunit alcohol dehydrogenase family)